MSDYFIRYPDSEEAKGPYNIEQLQSLCEAKKVTPDTLHYDEEKEVWIAIRGNKDLHETLFPKEKKLTLRKKDEAPVAETKEEPASEPDINVSEILAAAEGETQETKDKVSDSQWRLRTMIWASHSLTLSFIISGLGLTFLHLESVLSGDPSVLLKNPFVLLAGIDILFGVFLALSVTAIYPLVRLRAALGIGFFLIYFYSFDQMTIAVLAALSMVGIYVNTFIARISVFIFTGPMAILGTVAYLILYFLYLNPAVPS